jgi:hypothetical protein
MSKFKIVLLRNKQCLSLEKAVNIKLQEFPNFFENYSESGAPVNGELFIGTDWNTLTYLAIKEKADVNDFRPEDILAYFNLSVKKPAQTIEQLSLISFCKDINLICEISGKILDLLYDIYSIKTICFCGMEGEITHRLFELVMSNQKLSDKYFSNWSGRYIGYRTNQAVNQKNITKNVHLFEILRR